MIIQISNSGKIGDGRYAGSYGQQSRGKMLSNLYGNEISGQTIA
jgi:hypothetical protein